jgi:nucleotide-binding universal stress UspA family protein
MNKLKNVLVGVDFSKCSRCALEQAVRLARWNDGGLRIIHVMPPPALPAADEALRQTLDELRGRMREEAIARLAEWAEAAGAPAGHSREVINGVPLDVLLTESRSKNADLLVLGVTGESLLSTGAGTLATKCLRKGGTKVMLVNATHARPFRRIVACVDFSETSREAVAQAGRVAGRDRAEVHLLHVFQPEWRVWSSITQPPALGDFEQGYRTLLEGNLRHFAGALPQANPIVSVCPGQTHGHGIAEYCRTVDADLVILGSKGQTNLKYVLLGSTVERLLKEIPCSVLVVRPPAAAVENTSGGKTGQ